MKKKKIKKLKYADLKSEAHFKYKKCSNLLSTSLKLSKQSNYFQIIFKQILMISKNAWKGIKKLIYLKRASNFVPFAVIENTITLTRSQEIVIAFKKDFISISSTIQSAIKFSKKKFIISFLI